MAVGENSSFTLGLAADGPVREARKVSLEGVSKFFMRFFASFYLTSWLLILEKIVSVFCLSKANIVVQLQN